MRFKEFYINESSGVTNRQPGDVYQHNDDNEQHLVLQQVYLLPPNDVAYDTFEDLKAAITENVPQGEELIEENPGKTVMRAAILAHWADQDGVDQWRIKYVKNFNSGPHGKYIRPEGYKYAKSAQQESVPIKPSDLINPAFNPIANIGAEIITNAKVKLANSEYADIIPMLEEAINFAYQGQTQPIKNGAKYANVITKYAGEYLGPIAVVAGGIRKGDFDKALNYLNITSLEGATISFPDDKAGELIDSIIRLQDGTELKISTKMKKAGGKASSLAGVYRLVTDDLKEEYPVASKILEKLATQPALSTKNMENNDKVGIVSVALDLGVLNQTDVDVFKRLPVSSKNVDDLKDAPNLYRLTSTQGVSPNAYNNEGYRVYFHALAAIANDIIPILNGPQHQDFRELIKKGLTRTNYIQFLTAGTTKGDDLILDYTTKFPATFEGEPKIFNANYYATGQKGRLGFKLM